MLEHPGDAMSVLGYGDRLSAGAGERIRFMVSCAEPHSCDNAVARITERVLERFAEAAESERVNGRLRP